MTTTMTEAMLRAWINVKTAALIDSARRVIPLDQLGGAILGIAIGVLRKAGKDANAIRSALETELGGTPPPPA